MGAVGKADVGFFRLKQRYPANNVYGLADLAEGELNIHCGHRIDADLHILLDKSIEALGLDLYVIGSHDQMADLVKT